MSQTTLASLEGVRKTLSARSRHSMASISRSNRGELLAVLGPNGAGKSTAISILLGLQAADAGSAQLFGHDPQEIDGRRRIGVMMQEVMLPGVMRPRELLEQVASYYPTPYDVDAVIKRLSLESLAQRPYGKLSGGQKRQVQFALAICGRPELLFLDEPTVGLDVQAREALWKVVRELQARRLLHRAHHSLSRGSRGARRPRRGHGARPADHQWHRQRNPRARVAQTGELREPPRRRHGARLARGHAGRAWSATACRSPRATPKRCCVRLFREDPQLSDIEVKRAGLAEAFTELTNDTAREAA